jgi:hypothetical protein
MSSTIRSLPTPTTTWPRPLSASFKQHRSESEGGTIGLKVYLLILCRLGRILTDIPSPFRDEGLSCCSTVQCFAWRPQSGPQAGSRGRLGDGR